jgi:hypothetical protein
LDGADLTLAERAVLWGQYKYADKNGTQSRVSEETLGRYLSVDARTVRRHRKALRAKGWLVEKYRGRNTGTDNEASTYEVVIPSGPSTAEPKPKRVPNPTGRNQHTKGATGQIRPVGLEDTLTKNPRFQEDRINHLPTIPKIDPNGSNLLEDVKQDAKQDPWVVTNGTQVQPGSPGGDREMARLKEGQPLESSTSTADSESVEPVGIPLVASRERSERNSETARPDLIINTSNRAQYFCRDCHEEITGNCNRQGDGVRSRFRYTHPDCRQDPWDGAAVPLFADEREFWAAI